MKEKGLLPIVYARVLRWEVILKELEVGLEGRYISIPLQCNKFLIPLMNCLTIVKVTHLSSMVWFGSMLRSSLKSRCRMDSSCLAALQEHPFQDHSSCWKNFVPCSCGNEVHIFLLSVSQSPLTAPRSCLHSLTCGLLQL